jgi:membrane associated rhomboid family serine protease
VTGYAGTMAAGWADPGALVPVLGASAAVGGVVGGYVALFPRSRILLLVPATDGPDAMEVPALLVPGFWLLAQAIWSLESPLTAASGAGIAAHVGGAAAGAVAVWIFRQPARARVEWWGA